MTLPSLSWTRCSVVVEAGNWRTTSLEIAVDVSDLCNVAGELARIVPGAGLGRAASFGGDVTLCVRNERDKVPLVVVTLDSLLEPTVSA
jgi:hypothetical protein